MQDLLTQFTDRQLKLFAACMSTLLIAAIVSYGFWPKVQQLRSLQDNRDVMADVTANDHGAAGEIDRLHNEIAAMRSRLQGDMVNLPVRQMESFIIGRLQTISWRNDVTLVGVEPADGESVEMYKEVLFRVQLDGDYFNLNDWLGDVSEELGYVVIKEFQLTVADDEPQDPLLKARLLLAAYRVMDN